jgi:hypothetical protein
MPVKYLHFDMAFPWMLLVQNAVLFNSETAHTFDICKVHVLTIIHCLHGIELMPSMSLPISNFD